MELKAYLSVLLVKELSFTDKVKDFKTQIKEKFNKDYPLEEIEDELFLMKLEQECYINNIIEIPEDY